MPDWLLDSGALIDWFCGCERVARYVRRIVDGQAQGAFSTVSEIELWQGLRPGEEVRHEALLSFLERVPLDSLVARRAGELRQRYGLARLSLPDAAIAASAELTGRTLVTRDARDFRQLEGTVAIEIYGRD